MSWRSGRGLRLRLGQGLGAAAASLAPPAHMPPAALRSTPSATSLSAHPPPTHAPPCPHPCSLPPTGTLAELLPLQRAFGSSTLAHLALYPAACRLLRWAASWPLPAALLRAVLGAPLLWLWRRLLWQPRWWLSLPAAAALLLAAELGAKVPAAQKRVPTVLWLLAAMCAATW